MSSPGLSSTEIDSRSTALVDLTSVHPASLRPTQDCVFQAFGRGRIRKRCCARADVVLLAGEFATEGDTDAYGAKAEEAQQHDPHRGCTRCDEAGDDGW
jgi:hypothetical protein